MEEKKLLGLGGHAFAKLTEQEEIKTGLGVPHLFLGNVGRLSEDKISRYYRNKCRKEHSGSPVITMKTQARNYQAKVLFLSNN